MPFNLFHKKKQPEQEKPAVPPQEEPKTEAAPVSEEPKQEASAQPQETKENPEGRTDAFLKSLSAEENGKSQETLACPVEQKQEAPSKTYLKAMPLKELADLENIKNEVKNGNIIILRVTPLANKSIEDVKTAVNELYQFAESTGGDIARLGEERVVICPKAVRIWREKSPAPVTSEPLPTAA